MDKQLEYKIDELVFKSLENLASSEECSELETIINNSTEAFEYYCSSIDVNLGLLKVKDVMGVSLKTSMLLDSLAEYEENAPGAEIEQEIPEIRAIPPRNEITRKDIRKKLLMLAAFIMISIGIIWLDKKIVNYRGLYSEGHTVASIVSRYDAEWGNAPEDIIDNDRLWGDGRLYHFDRGLVELKFDSGASLIVQSPAKFRIYNDKEIFLHDGSVSASVNKSAYGFTIETIHSKAVDLGTEFAVKTSYDAGTELHVKQGKVEFVEIASGKNQVKAKVLYAGEGCLVDKAGIFSTVAFNSEDFCWNMPEKYNYAVIKSKPSFYWSFNNDQDRTLLDEVSSKVNPDSKILGNVTYQTNAIPGSKSNLALNFTGRHEDSVILRYNDPVYDEAPEFSTAMLIKPVKKGDDDIILCVRKPDGNGWGNRFTVKLCHDNEISFILSGDKSSVSLDSDPIKLGQWHHIVVSYRNNDRAYLYVDGKLADSEVITYEVDKLSDEAKVYWCLGSGLPPAKEIENVDIDTIKRRSFCGYVDEISQYNRMLSQKEVQALYNASK